MAWVSERWAVVGRGEHEFERSTGAGSPGVAVRITRGSVTTGPRFQLPRRFDVRVVAGFEFGVARGRGFRVPGANEDRVFWRAISVGATFAHSWRSRAFVALNADVRASLGTVQFVVARGEQLDVLGPVGATLRLGGGVRF